MSAHRLTLAQQLKQLESDDPSSNPLFNPDNDDTALDGLSRPAEGIHREHYLDVGPSRLRNQMGGLGGLEGAEQTLRSEKYGGKVTGRMKIFDDDEDEEEGGDGVDEDDEEGEEEGDEEDEEEGDEEGEEDDDEDEDEDEEESDGDEEDEDEEDEEDEGDEDDEEEESAPPRARPGSSKALDPIAALKDSRLKDIEKGRGIRRQRSLFENLITLRISFQKAFVTGSKLSFPLPSDPEGEIEAKRQDTLRSLAELSDKLFALREALPLPGVELPEGLGKRKREDDDVLDEQYWMAAAGDSLDIENASRPHLVPILNKWSSKIQAATLQLGSKQAGSSKFLASTKGVPGIVEAIEAGLASKRESDRTLVENEEASYRALLREVIESRGAAGSGVDLTHLRREKKKKREAERGGSKGRKLRYTVHEKAQNFVVPIPLGQGWHEEQVDELFSSLFGGVGMSGAVSEGVSNGIGASESEGPVGLGGLRVF